MKLSFFLSHKEAVFLGSFFFVPVFILSPVFNHRNSLLIILRSNPTEETYRFIL